MNADAATTELSSRGGHDRRSIAVIVGAIATYVALLGVGARGVRGSDQYWYVTDLLMSATGAGTVSNSIYPTRWLTVASPDQLPPPIHHIPVVYLATLVDTVVHQGYLSFVLMNMALALVAAAMVYSTARSWLSPLTSAIALALFLLSPPILWSSANAMSEMFTVAAAALLLLSAVRLHTRPRVFFPLFLVATLLITASRDNYALVVPAAIAFLIWQRRPASMSVGMVWLFSVVATLGLIVNRLVFTPYPTSGLIAVLRNGTAVDVSGTPGVSAFYPSDDLPTIFMLVTKAANNALWALIPNGGQDLLLETGLIAALILGSVAVRKSAAGRVVSYWGLTFLAIYVITCMVFQSQPRYLAAAIPAAAVLAVGGTSALARSRGIPRRGRAIGVVVTFGGLVAMGTVLMTHYASSAISETAMVNAVRTAIPAESDSSTIAVNLDSVQQSQVAFAVAPHPLLFVNTNGTWSCVPSATVASWQVRTIVAPTGLSVDEVGAALCDLPAGSLVVLDPDLPLPSGHIQVLDLQRR